MEFLTLGSNSEDAPPHSGDEKDDPPSLLGGVAAFLLALAAAVSVAGAFAYLRSPGPAFPWTEQGPPRAYRVVDAAYLRPRPDTRERLDQMLRPDIVVTGVAGTDGAGGSWVRITEGEHAGLFVSREHLDQARRSSAHPVDTD
jgi:hypothetical protein